MAVKGRSEATRVLEEAYAAANRLGVVSSRLAQHCCRKSQQSAAISECCQGPKRALGAVVLKSEQTRNRQSYAEKERPGCGRNAPTQSAATYFERTREFAPLQDVRSKQVGFLLHGMLLTGEPSRKDKKYRQIRGSSQCVEFLEIS